MSRTPTYCIEKVQMKSQHAQNIEKISHIITSQRFALASWTLSDQKKKQHRLNIIQLIHFIQYVAAFLHDGRFLSSFCGKRQTIMLLALQFCSCLCACVRCAVLYARRPRKYYHLQDNSTLFDCTMVMCVQCPLHTCYKSALCVCQRLHMSYHYIIVTVVNRCGYVYSNFGQLCVLWS